MICRIEKHQKNFLIIQKAVLELTTLSFKAKGLWAYLMSLPDDWEVKIKHLTNTFPEGETAINNMLNELIEHGIVERRQDKDENGQWGPVIYIIHELPFKKCLPQGGFPLAGNPLADNHPPTKEPRNQGTKRTTTIADDGGDREVVVFSSLDKLNLDSRTIKYAQRNYSEEEVNKAVEHCLRWKGRKSDPAALRTILKNPEDWKKTVTAEERAERNREWLKNNAHLDGKAISGYTVHVGPNYIQFVSGSRCNRFEVDSPNFEADVTKFREMMKGDSA